VVQAAGTAARVIQQQQQQCHQQPAHNQPTQNEQQQRAVLGYIIVQVNSVTAHINKLAVASHARRQGLGAALLRVR
jgi:ribosomal protein S18 acetylase RimI-like enzyme